MGLWLDSFDHYTNLLDKYDGALYAEIIDSKGRYGTAGLSVYLASGSSGGYVYRDFTDSPYWSVGVAWIRDNLIRSENFMNPVMGIRDANSSTQVNVYLNQDSTMTVTSGAGNDVIATMTKPTHDNKFYYIELRTFISPTDGWVELWLNSSLRASAYGVNTDTAASGIANRVSLFSGGNPYFDDLSVKYGDTEQSRFGDNRIVCLYPSADGAYSQWTPSSGSAHYSLVNEAPPNTATYLTSSGSPIDTFDVDTLGSALGKVAALQVTALCKLTSAGTRTIEMESYSGGLHSLGTATVGSTTYRYATVSSGSQPVTNIDWTVAAVNANEYGFTLL